MALNYRYNKKGKVTGIGWGKGKNYEAGQKRLEKTNKTSSSTKTSDKLKIEKRKRRDAAITKAKNRGKPGSSRGALAAKEMSLQRKEKGITLKQAKAKQDKDMRDAARKNYDEFQKKHKRGKYSDREKKKALKKHTSKSGGKYQFTTM
mgnify:CR=1 FL=1